jgi:hypothetical protein
LPLWLIDPSDHPRIFRTVNPVDRNGNEREGVNLKGIIRLSLIAATALTSSCSSRDKGVYMFSCFKGNGEDGLHLAWSNKGLPGPR